MQFRQIPLRKETYDDSKAKAVTYLRSRAVSRRDISNYVVDPTRGYSISETERILNVDSRYITFLAGNNFITIRRGVVDGSSLDSLCQEVFSGLENRVKTKVNSGKGRKIRNKNGSSLGYGGDDSLSVYFKTIQHYNPLSSEEERELAKRIKRGDYGARNRLVEANLRFVVSVSKGYQNCGLTLSELISEGNRGLLKAAERFDGDKGFKFISYAVWWIKQAILEKLANSRVVRIPINVNGDLLKINKAIERLSDSRNTLNLKELVEDVANDLNLDPELVEDTLSVTHATISLDKLREDYDGSDSLLDRFPDSSQKSPDEAVNMSSLKDSIKYCMDCLDSREARVIQLYYGLDGEKALTLEEVGACFGFTRERARQIRDIALNKMRRPTLIKRLGDYKDLVY